jgi:hypothetical protein
VRYRGSVAEPIYLETSRTWSFAAAVEWPGWCRHAKGTADPVEPLLAYAERYGAALAQTGVRFERPAEVEMVEFLEGDKGTEWGVPSIVPSVDRRPVDDAEARRLVAILEAAWLTFDRAVDAAEGRPLRTGPRGGGRDLPRLIDHCVEADKVYLSKLGARRPRVDTGDWHDLVVAMRERALETFRDRVAGRPIREPSRARTLWLPRWYVRYVTWHTLHHAWELEDRLEA